MVKRASHGSGAGIARKWSGFPKVGTLCGSRSPDGVGSRFGLSFQQGEGIVMRRSLHVLILLWVTVWLMTSNPFARSQELNPAIHKARNLLCHNCHIGIALLESAVQSSPHDIACWEEYVYELNFSTRFYFAERASRESLRLNPDDPVLLVSRARILQPAPALDVLALLEKRPGHSEEAKRLRELVQLGLGVPRDWNDLSLYVDWAKANSRRKRWNRALAAVDEGLRKSNMPPQYDGNPELVRELLASKAELLASKAMVLVNTGKFDQAMELEKACDYLQLVIDGGYDGIGDNLLDLNRPDLAIRSFGGKTPEKQDNREKDEQRMVLACAYAETKDLDRAERLLRGATPRHKFSCFRRFWRRGRTSVPSSWELE